MADIQLHNEGSLVGFLPLTEEGRTWLREEVQAEPWQFANGVLLIDHRMAAPILEAASDDGLILTAH